MTIWTVPLTEYTNDADKGIVVCHWRATLTDGDYSASSYGTAGFSPDPSSPDYTPYDSVTEAEVLGWCWANGVDQEAIEASLQANIDLQITPTNGTGVPW